MNDDFFDIGGNSFLAVELIGRVRSKYHVELILRTFYFAPTVADLAEVISTQPHNGKD
ncbi:phosphopantetheine-binding protein [Streptomyces sp. NPDC005953]|uniref:phosphopantetheine-binding protein n=1 Tax=Streptomyces sp. NPDC005953 TaxID=3156719 RepID=UPI0034000F43